MANLSHDPNAWVDESLRSLDRAAMSPPDLTRARARLRDRRIVSTRVRRRRLWALAVTTGALLVVAALPSSRAVAQRMLDRLTLSRIDVIPTTPVEPPERVVAALVMQPQPWDEVNVRDLDEAQRAAGYRLALPTAEVLSGTPRFTVIRKATLNTSPLEVTEIEAALAAAGVRDVAVPKNWEGIVLHAETGPAVVADYGSMQLIQSLPFRMTTPTDVPFGRFMELVFRVFGRSEAEARRLGERLVENPAIVLHFPGASEVRDVSLASGNGVLVGNPEGRDGMCFFWSTPERIYILEADHLSESRAVAVANSLRETPEPQRP